MSTPAKCLPSATAIGSTFDSELLNTIGSKILAQEARLKSVSVLLGPTVNIQRHPLGGRSFESFAEDPHLSGTLAAAYINGLQSEGIAGCIKHFLGNDKENDRRAYDSIMSERALREIYLMPFMLTEKHAKPWCYMTAYAARIPSFPCTTDASLQQLQPREWHTRLGKPEDYPRHSPERVGQQCARDERLVSCHHRHCGFLLCLLSQVRRIFDRSCYQCRARPRDARKEQVEDA